MKSNRIGWMLAISVSLSLALMTAACGSLAGPWAGAPGAPRYESPGTAPSIQASCDGGTAYSARGACGSPWLMSR